MILPINMESGADFISKMSSARAADASAQYTSAKADQQMYETKEYISDTQKALRKARAEADTSMANADKMKADIVREQPDLYRQVYESGMGAQMQKSLAEKGEAINDQITNALGTEIKDIEDYANKYSAMIQTNPDLVKLLGLPTLDQAQKDPSQLPRVKMLAGSAWANKSEFARQRAILKEEGDIRSRQIQEEGGIRKDLQEDEQKYQSGENRANRSFQANQAQLNRDFEAGESHLKMDWQSGENAMDRALKREIARLDYDAAMFKARREGKDKVPKVADILGETTTNFKKNTATQIVDRIVKERGLSLPVEMRNQLGYEAGNQALADWDRAVKAGEVPEHPGVMVEKLVDYYIASGRVTQKEVPIIGLNYSTKMIDADSAMIKMIGEKDPDRIEKANSLYKELMKESEFQDMNQIAKERIIRKLMGDK